MNIVELLGTFAGVLTSFAFFPQIIKLVKTRQSAGISIITYVTTLLGCLLWFIYGVFISSYPLIFFNVLNIITSTTILVLSNRYSKLNFNR